MIPGVTFNFSQAIQDNVQEAMSGVKGEHAVKLYGSDLQTLEQLAAQIELVMKDVQGVKDLGVLQSREARIILGAAVIDDVLGLLVLAVVAGTVLAAG